MPTEDTGAAPERVDAGMLVLRRLRATDAGEIAAAVSASMDHLRPWMPWATPEAAQHQHAGVYPFRRGAGIVSRHGS